MSFKAIIQFVVIHSLNCLVSFASLFLILDDVLHLKLAHTLDFIEIYHETLIISMKRFNALSTEDCQMIRTVEVLDSLWMFLAQLFTQCFFVFILKVERGFSQDWVLFDYFIEDINVKRKSFSTFKLLNQFSANWASYTILVVQLLDAVCT